MSLCSPLWGDDKDSDISEPDSGDRVTIYTNELSPTPSELYCMQQVSFSHVCAAVLKAVSCLKMCQVCHNLRWTPACCDSVHHTNDDLCYTCLSYLK